MELKIFVNMVIKRLWIVILLLIIGTAGTAYYSIYMVKPLYMSNTTLYLINKNEDTQPLVISDLQISGQLIMDYTALIMSRNIQEAVIVDLGSKGIKATDLGDISANSIAGTRIINIVVEHTDPKMAMDVANSIADVFSKKVVELMKIENVSIIDKANMPLLPINQNFKRNTLIAVLASLFLAVAIILFIEYLDNTIRTKEDVEKYLDLPVIGTIPVNKARLGGPKK